MFLTSPLAQVAEALGAEAGGLSAQPRHNIAPGQEVIACTSEKSLASMRWGLIPVGRKNARGRPVLETIVNVRSETVFDKTAFDGLRRCLVPADGWYEWTGERRKKTAWRIARRDGGLLVFAAVYDIWRAPSGQEIAQVATLTCPPNGDLAPIHDRMGVIVAPSDFQLWLAGSPSEATTILRPLPDGEVQITEAAGVDWDGP
jgi:putative SOS response-associated peptidase YedK